MLDGVWEFEFCACVGILIGGCLSWLSRCWCDWCVGALVGLHSGWWDVLMVQYWLIDELLLGDVVECDGWLYVWMVNLCVVIVSLRGLGVHGIIMVDL